MLFSSVEGDAHCNAVAVLKGEKNGRDIKSITLINIHSLNMTKVCICTQVNDSTGVVSLSLLLPNRVTEECTDCIVSKHLEIRMSTGKC